MLGAHCARSLACKIKLAYEHSHHGHTGNTRHSLRNGFNSLFRALPGLFCHRRLQFTTCQLDASVGASGPHDFVVRALSAARPRAAKASTASRLTSVTFAKRPSVEAGRGEVVKIRHKQNIFGEGDWTAQITLSASGNRVLREIRIGSMGT
jgi:hypothetical protein